MGEGRVAGLRRLRLGATGDVEEIAVKRLRQAVDQLRFLEDIDDVVSRRVVRHARSGADGREIVARYIGNGEAMRRSRSDGERKSAAAPTSETPAHGIDGGDVEPRGEEQIEQLSELGFGHATQRRGNEARGAAADEHEGDVAAFHARGDLADALRRRERSWSGDGMVAGNHGEGAVGRAFLVRPDDQSAGDLVE